mgnify:CR=1 FL=1
MKGGRSEGTRQAAAWETRQVADASPCKRTRVAKGAARLARQLLQRLRQAVLLHVAPPLPRAEVAGLPARGVKHVMLMIY